MSRRASGGGNTPSRSAPAANSSSRPPVVADVAAGGASGGGVDGGAPRSEPEGDRTMDGGCLSAVGLSQFIFVLSRCHQSYCPLMNQTELGIHVFAVLFPCPFLPHGTAPSGLRPDDTRPRPGTCGSPMHKRPSRRKLESKGSVPCGQDGYTTTGRWLRRLP